jgi:nucleotide-binding universal stress UspA family protein
VTSAGEQPLLLCYDGSPGAAHAIAYTARLLPGRRAVVLSVWSSPIGMAVHGMAREARENEAEQQRIAADHASEGCELAREAGLLAAPLTACGSGTGIPEAILATADDRDAALIVLGTRGLGGLHAMFLGSVSEAVTRHARRDVLLVPANAPA